MFANFNKAFKRDKSDTRIPQSILNAMSNKLPSGLKYTQADREYCKVIPVEGDLTIKFHDLKINIPKEIQIKTTEELTEFLYRTQQELETNADVVTVNGNDLKISDLIKSPFKDESHFKEGKIIIKPQPFGEPFPLKIVYDEENIVKEFMVERKPLPDMNKSLFKSIDNDMLDIVYTIDEKESRLNFSVHINISRAKTISQIIEGFKIYIAFIEGKIKVGDMPLNSISDEKERGQASIALKYWETVQIVADKLNVQFNPNDGDAMENEEWTDRLYRTLVENKPYKQSSGMANFVTKLTDATIDAHELIEKGAMAFQFSHEEVVKLYGVEVPLYNAVALLNCKVESVTTVDDNENVQEIKIVPADEKGIDRAVIHFDKKEELEVFFGNPGEVLEELTKAEEL
ncbi:abortive infection system toxin AbiGii family protein [Bacillus cereus]|uniref:abortive infection system toxin AbiGii family protein n=1 Tax=Bacillus cereus TaxID=1396 RepID=UPI003D661381